MMHLFNFNVAKNVLTKFGIKAIFVPVEFVSLEEKSLQIQFATQNIQMNLDQVTQEKELCPMIGDN